MSRQRNAVDARVIGVGDVLVRDGVIAVPRIVLLAQPRRIRNVRGGGDRVAHDRRRFLRGDLKVVGPSLVEVKLGREIAGGDRSVEQRFFQIAFGVSLDGDAVAGVVLAGDIVEEDIHVGVVVGDGDAQPLGGNAESDGPVAEYRNVVDSAHGERQRVGDGFVTRGGDAETPLEEFRGDVVVFVHRVDPVVVGAVRGDAALVAGIGDRGAAPSHRVVFSGAVLQHIGLDAVRIGGGIPVDDEIPVRRRHRGSGGTREHRSGRIHNERRSIGRCCGAGTGICNHLPGVIAVELVGYGVTRIRDTGVSGGYPVGGDIQRIVVNAETVVSVTPAELHVGTVGRSHCDLGCGDTESGRRGYRAGEADRLAGDAVHHVETLDRAGERVHVAFAVRDRDTVIDLAHPRQHRHGIADGIVEDQGFAGRGERIGLLTDEVLIVGDIDGVDDVAVVGEGVAPSERHGERGEC